MLAFLYPFENGGPTMPNFTIQELNLICLYDTGTRIGLLNEITNMTRALTSEDMELQILSESVIKKMSGLTDEEYDALMRNADFCFNEEDEYGG